MYLQIKYWPFGKTFAQTTYYLENFFEAYVVIPLETKGIQACEVWVRNDCSESSDLECNGCFFQQEERLITSLYYMNLLPLTFLQSYCNSFKYVMYKKLSPWEYYLWNDDTSRKWFQSVLVILASYMVLEKLP